MAGFALLVDFDAPPSPESPAWKRFLVSVQNYKCLDDVSAQAQGGMYIAAKFDAPCSRHTGITVDTTTGSWMLAAGSLIDTADLHSDGNLSRLLHNFQEEGEAVFARLDGQFALVAFNAMQRTLSAVSDPFGMIPLYFGENHHRTYVSTSALAVAKAVRATPGELQARSFLLYGDTGESSLWSGVERLAPATVRTYSPQGVRSRRYWTPHLDPSISRQSFDDAANGLIEGLSQSAKAYFQREGRFWLSLTGGLDSRTLAAVAMHSALPFKTYCHGPSDSRDVNISAALSREMGWEYEYFSLPSCWGSERVHWLWRAFEQTDGHMDVLKMSRILREQTRKAHQMSVSLWGYGGELYRGYYWKQEFAQTGRTSKVNYQRLLNFRIIPSPVAFMHQAERWQIILREEKMRLMKEVGEQDPDWPNTAKLNRIGHVLEQHAGSNTIAGILGLQRVLLPYYSKDNFTRILSTNYKWQLHSQLFRSALERVDPRLAAMALADGGPAMPMRLSSAIQFVPYWIDTGEKLLWRLGNTYLRRSLWPRRDAGPDGKAYPVERWIQETTAHLFESELLIPGKMISEGLYEPKALHAFINQAAGGQLSDEKLFGRILTLEMAYQTAGSFA